MDFWHQRSVWPIGTEAVVTSGIFMRAASFARAVVLARNSATLMSLTFWNNPA